MLRWEDFSFQLTAAWHRSAEPIDLVFKLTLADDQDILSGRLDKVGGRTGAFKHSCQLPNPSFGIGALMVGVLLTLTVSASVARRRRASSTTHSGRATA